MKYYVYAHINSLTLKPFYIGKGTGQRAYSTDGRSTFWNRTVSKYGYFVTILIDGLDDTQALAIETQYIKRYELRIKGGTLVNLNYGGRGGNTYNEFNIERVRVKCRESKLGSKNPNFGKKTWLYGKSMPEETKAKLSIARTGYKTPDAVKVKVLAGLKKAQAANRLKAQKVRCLTTNKVWNNRHDCIAELDISLATFKQRILRACEIKGNYLQYIKK